MKARGRFALLVGVITLLPLTVSTAGTASAASAAQSGMVVAHDPHGDSMFMTWTVVPLKSLRKAPQAPLDANNKCAGWRPVCQTIKGTGRTVNSWVIWTWQFPSDGQVCDPTSFYVWNWNGTVGNIWSGPWTTGGCYTAPRNDAIQWTANLQNWQHNAVPFKFPHNNIAVGQISPFGTSGTANVHS